MFARAPVAQLDRALACGAKGRAFESRRVYHQDLISRRQNGVYFHVYFYYAVYDWRSATNG